MKRTKTNHHPAFRKRGYVRHLTPVALAITTVLALAGCDQSDETVTLYQNADDCSKAHPGQSEQCQKAWQSAQKEAERTAPKYASREDCVAEFGEDQCQPVPTQAGTGASNATAQSGTSFWMPLMTGYMMGRLLGSGFAAQPLFTPRSSASPINGQFVDASGRRYGAAASGRTMTVPKTALAPKPATTHTITRGGFGEMAAKHANMQRSSNGYRSHRSMGG